MTMLDTIIDEDSEPTLALEYLYRIEGDSNLKEALLAISVALELNDNTARKIIEHSTEAYEITEDILLRIKSLACVWEAADGNWFIDGIVRRGLLDKYIDENDQVRLNEILDILAGEIDKEIENIQADHRYDFQRQRQLGIKAAYYGMLGGHTKKATNQFVRTWKESKTEGKRQVVEAVRYLSNDFEKYLDFVPMEIYFLNGLSSIYRGGDTNLIENFSRAFEEGYENLEFPVTDAIQKEIFVSVAILLAAFYTRFKMDEGNIKAEDYLSVVSEFQLNDHQRASVLYALGTYNKNQYYDLNTTISYLEQALNLFRDPIDKARASCALGETYLANNDSRSKKYFSDCLAFLNELPSLDVNTRAFDYEHVINFLWPNPRELYDDATRKLFFIESTFGLI